jgi:bacillithiol biosynthesis cysteine-adding enzyme BshC
VSQLITPSKDLGYSKIYLDFIAGRETAGSFYRAETAADVAERLSRVQYDREWIYDILRKQNISYGASSAALANIEKLKDPTSLCVFSGQQAILFGGPLLVMIKAIAVVKAAEEYSRQLKRLVVPVFWIAGDDHDFEEANHTVVLNRQSEEVGVAYETYPEQQIPVAQITFNDKEALQRAKASLRDALGETDFTPRYYELIDKAYQPGDSMVESFGKLMAALTADLGLVLFCPGDREVKSHAAGFFKSIAHLQPQLHDVISSANQAIVERGYHLQVEKADNATHLFLNDGGRKPIMRDGDRFVVGDKTLTAGELNKQIDDFPEQFSPDVMTRPVFQSFLFPVVSQKGGPAEIAYLAQINPIFELFDLPAPLHRARPTATFIEKRFEKIMADHDISFEDLTGDIEQTINRVLATSFPENLEKEFEELRSRVRLEFEQFSKDSLEFDQSLKQVSKQTSGKIDFLLNGFEGKVFSAHKKKSKEARERIYRLHRAAFTGRGLQERTLNVGYFLSKYGFEFVKFMYDRIDINEKAHQVIYLSESER